MKARRRKTTRPKGGKAPLAARRRSTSAAGLNKKIARLTRERDEALEQQRAAAEVLKVISGSTFALQTVLDTLVESAAKLCQADIGYLRHRDNDVYRLAATYGLSPEQRKLFAQYSTKPDRGSLFGRALIDGRTVHIPDVVADPDFGRPEAQRIIGFRAALAVPLRRGSDTLGVLTVQRMRPEPFSQNQIALIETFADQAVIAIENTRLFSELRQRTDDLTESLEQQTATSGVLNVISNSVTDAQPVFDAIVQSGLRLFPNDAVFIALPDSGMIRAAAMAETDPERAEAWKKRFPFLLNREYMHGLSILDRRVVDVPDVREAPPDLVTGAKNFLASGYRAVTIMPMMRGGEAIGALSVVRMEPGPLSDKQRATLKAFADQAVIAIENARLLRELRQRTDDLTESLEQQTATSEVLKVISISPGELEPVFQSVLENAVHLCGAKFGALSLRDGDAFRSVAMHGTPSSFNEARQRDPLIRVTPGHNLDIAVRTKAVVHLPNLTIEQAGPPLFNLAGARALLNAPLLKDGEVIGSIAIYRTEPGPFADKQIELVQNFAAQAVIAIENTRLLNELRQRTDDLTESLEQQTATGEILAAISASMTDTQPVFETIVKNAARLCQSVLSAVYRSDGELAHLVAHDQFSPDSVAAVEAAYPVPLGSENLIAQAVRERRVVHEPDVLVSGGYSELQQASGYRAILVVPMMRDDVAIGAIAVMQIEPRLFPESRVALLKTFAAQAVIAIENTRLLNELRQRTDDLTEALEQQTATSEVLSVISSSPGDLQPVFDAMLENATRICEAKVGNLFLREGDSFRAVAVHGESEYANWFRREPIAGTLSGSPLERVSRTKQVLHIHDLRQDQSYLDGQKRIVSLVDTAGARTHIVVPLLKESELLGAIVIYRQEVRPFSDKQIELLTNFAAQAVIAIENTRLLNELRQRTDDLSESLEQQTATSEVLKVISSSQGDLQPVFDALLANATKLCKASYGTMWLHQGDGQLRAAALHGDLPAAYLTRWGVGTVHRPNISVPAARVTKTYEPVQVADLSRDRAYLDGDPLPVDAVEIAGIRTLAVAPMIKDGNMIGNITIYRREVRPFTEKQMELLTNFAAQAVIAIENTRLLNELRQRTDDLTESLEQQTATSEVLSVISSSPGELGPVFEAMLDNAVRICGAKFGNLWLRDGDLFRVVATHGVPPAYRQMLMREAIRPGPDTGLGMLMKTKRFVQIEDITKGKAYAERDPLRVATVEIAGGRTLVEVPLLKDNELVGSINIYRQEVRPFSDKQIELLTNFAAQAVIAIENTRLLNELRQRTDDLSESLEQQTATSEVLRVISSSPGELEPVFQSVLQNSVKICDAKYGQMFLYEREAFRVVANLNVPAALAEFQQGRGSFQPRPGGLLERVLRDRQVLRVADAMSSDYSDRPAQLGRQRSLIGVPLLKKETLIGVLAIYRQEVRPFTDKQIELVQNFAAQAVIAIENARLLNELRESLENQTASADILRTIASSPARAEQALDVIAETTARRFGASDVNIRLLDGNVLRYVGSTGPMAAQRQAMFPEGPLDPNVSSGRAILERRQIYLRADTVDPSGLRIPSRATGILSSVATPLIREGEAIGALMVLRSDPRPFSEADLAQLSNFASQAVIAIENTRLLNELRESLAQQTATADVLKIISRSTFDLQSVLNTLVESAARLCEADMASINREHGPTYRQVASYGMPADLQAYMDRNPIPAGRGSVVGRTVAQSQIIHIHDVLADPDYRMTEAAKIGGIRTMLGVPLLREGTPIGVIALQRKTVRPFTDKQIELVSTFADQAVIAIENVRLFDEIQDKSRQLAEASQHKSQFLANMSHELRTPLNAILGYTELIVDGVYGAPSDKMQDVLKRIESNGKHLLGLINDVLDLSKIEAGQLVLSLSDYSLKDVVQTVFGAVEPLATEKNIELKIDVSADLPPGRGDERRLTQVLLNLVGNAIKFTDVGEVVIAASASNGSFNLAVRDTGPGISPADQAKLFQEFQQADNSITRKKGGTGLGLAISRRIIELHGGRIGVDSQVGQGSTFWVTLPVKAENQARRS